VSEAERGAALRVLHVDTDRVWRGGQAQIAILMDALARRGHRSTLAAPEGPLAERARASGHAHVPFAPRSDLDLVPAWSLARRAARERPDVVHLHSGRAHATGWLAARAAKAPAIVTRRVLFGGDGAPRLSLKWRLPLARVIAISTPIRDALARAGVAEDALVVVPDALDVAAFERAVAEARASGATKALRRAWGVPEDAPLAGMLAAFTHEKNHEGFIAAASRALRTLPEACFVALGDGPRLERMRARAEAKGLGERFRLPGRVADVAAAIGALDAFVLLTRAEGLGSSLLLAQAARVPAIASRVGGVPDVIEDGVTGRLVTPGEPSEAARAIVEALAGGAEIDRRVAEARRRVEEFDASAAGAAHERIYRAAIAQRAAGGRPWERPR
jgi:glycosyltransferase involved in cell wall biosynthesis